VCLYIHLSLLDVVVYVGRSGRGRRRTGEHQSASKWWGQVKSIVLIHTDDWWTTQSVEALLIHYYNPPYNKCRETGDHVLAAMHLVTSGQIDRLPQPEGIREWIEGRPEYKQCGPESRRSWKRTKRHSPNISLT